VFLAIFGSFCHESRQIELRILISHGAFPPPSARFFSVWCFINTKNMYPEIKNIEKTKKKKKKKKKKK